MVENQKEIITDTSKEREFLLADQVKTLAHLVKKTNIFSTDQKDEFVIHRENGDTQGIFKTWAVPIIPFLEVENLEGLESLLGDPEKTEQIRDIISQWEEWLIKNPARTWQTLERWRNFSGLSDERLFELFQNIPLPENKEDRVGELFLRLQTAFGFSAPFYHIEAFVGKKNDDFHESTFDTKQRGGFLDIVGLVLPSALTDFTVAQSLDWNGLSWDTIRDMKKELLQNRDSNEMAIAFRIARNAGVDIEDVIFASNALEWIPMSVGGKKGDVNKLEAERMIMDLSIQESGVSSTTIIRDMNALIRFLNWTPLHHGEENFIGKGWRYGAVCDTADKLLEEVQSNGIFIPEFQEIFMNHLKDQLVHIDATSAKGRLLLQLLSEGRFKKEIYDYIKKREQSFFLEIGKGLADIELREEVFDIHEHNPRFLVGGKVKGLQEAGIIFGKERVLDGFVVSSEAITRILQNNKLLWSFILKLNIEQDIEKKISLANTIKTFIKEIHIPNKLLLKVEERVKNFDRLAIRSSSFDEDTIGNGTAAGIYESVIDVDKSQIEEAMKTVIGSFFSEKAVSYRALHGLSDLPCMSVGFHEFLEGKGGVAFSHELGKGWKITVGKNPQSIVNNEHTMFDYVEFDGKTLKKETSHNWLTDRQINEIGDMISQSQKILGTPVDIEFSIDQDGNIKILQLRSLFVEKKHAEKTLIFSDTVPVLIQSIDDLNTLQVTEGIKTALSLDGDINLDQFQGDLFRWLVRHKNAISEIRIDKDIPPTCHFANICLGLGIALVIKKL